MLIVNGPCVGESQGSPTRYQMGAGFEAGMQYVEKAIQAKKIILYGFSLGGGMMGEAIIQHDFTQGIQAGVQYLCISDRTFSKLSTEAKALAEWVILQGAQMTLRGVFVLTGMEPEENEEILKLKEEAQALVRGVSKVVGVFVSAAFLLTGLDLEVVAAAKKLTEKNIQHVVIQHRCDEEEGTDGVILDRASLAFSLQNKQENQLFLTSPELRHNSPLPIDIQNALSEKVSQFLQ